MIVHTQYLGNQELLKLQKTAFLASGNIASEEVLRVYDWATEMRSRGECVISGILGAAIGYTTAFAINSIIIRYITWKHLRSYKAQLR